MSVLSFFRRRTKSRYVDDKAVEDFERVLTEQQRVDEAAKIIGRDDPSAANIEQLGRLLNE